MNAALDLLPWHEGPFQQLYQQWAAERLGHAWLITGPEGVGKGVFARHFAQRLFCRAAEGRVACGQCKDCQYFAAGTHPDWRFLRPEKKLITIDQVRDSMDFSFTHSQRGGYKVLCLAPAEAMNANAANALLKLLEEPPASTYFLLLSHYARMDFLFAGFIIWAVRFLFVYVFTALACARAFADLVPPAVAVRVRKKGSNR